jgi:hypothetical protein
VTMNNAVFWDATSCSVRPLLVVTDVDPSPHGNAGKLPSGCTTGGPSIGAQLHRVSE